VKLASSSKHRKSWYVDIETVGDGFVAGKLYFTGISYDTGKPVDGVHLEKRFRVKVTDNTFRIGVGSSGAKIPFRL
jgi:hypothetical protein